MNSLAFIMAAIVFYIGVTNDLTYTQAALAAAFVFVIFAVASGS